MAQYSEKFIFDALNKYEYLAIEGLDIGVTVHVYDDDEDLMKLLPNVDFKRKMLHIYFIPSKDPGPLFPVDIKIDLEWRSDGGWDDTVFEYEHGEIKTNNFDSEYSD